MSEIIDRVAKAIDGVEVGYHLSLTSLVDGVSTYTLDYEDGTPLLKFDCTDDAYAHISERKRLKIARAAIEAMREPSGYVSRVFPEGVKYWRAMIELTLKTGERG